MAGGLLSLRVSCRAAGDPTLSKLGRVIKYNNLRGPASPDKGLRQYVLTREYE